MIHIPMFSGGAGSWAAAKRVAAIEGTDNMRLLFADTCMEDEDLYRFLDEAAINIGAPLERVAEGRTPWEVFRDVKFLGNTRADPCSRILKRQFLRDWLKTNCDPANTIVYLGIDWSESHRMDRAAKAWEPWTVRAPLCDRPYLSKAEILAMLKDEGIEPPRLYGMGFPHNNCGGFCVKAGQAQFKLLLEQLPERYAEHEAQEESLREELGDVSILRDRRGGSTKPLTMREFRERIESNQCGQLDLYEWGGCGCAVDE